MTKSMLALVTEAYGGRGGIAQYNRDLLDALSGNASVFNSIEVLPRLAGAEAPLAPSIVRQLPATQGRALYSLRALHSASSRTPKVVFCGHLFMAPLAWAVAKVARARLVIQLHGIEIWRKPSQAQRNALEAADMVICVSRNTRAWAHEWANIPPERTIVIANTVADDFEPGDRPRARARFGFSEDEFVLLSVGRLDTRERYKGHDSVIAQLAHLPAPPGKSVRYIIAGDGDDRDRLSDLARSHGVAGRTQFLGQVDRTALPDLYRAADLFALPSRGEGFGIVFLEAMASGTPAIGLAVGGANDALGDGQLGWCVSPQDFPAGLARAVASPRRDSGALAAHVRARFGRDVFSTQAAAAFSMLGTIQ